MKTIAKIATALLVVGVGAAIYISVNEQIEIRNTEHVRGISGSEKIPFFRDAETVDLLARKPYQIDAAVEKAGSREIATYDLNTYDFAFPAGVPAAAKIQSEHNIRKAIDVYHSPMVIASWKPVAEVLMMNGVVEQRDGVHYVVDMKKLLKLIVEKTRWNELTGSEKYPANKSILVTTTDVRKSNSAAMYLSLASYVLNDERTLHEREQADVILEDLSSIFLRQGFTESSSAVPFQSYLTMGPGKSPMVMIYEAQFIEELFKENSAITDDMVLLYPQPTIYSKHVLIPLSPEGEALGNALANDEDIQKVAVRYGMRPKNIALFNEYIAQSTFSAPSTLYNVIDPPSFEILEYMITRIEQDYQ
ncbi:hypothetical protein [Thaumasiovibrio subtropicus]|uniref:hypothetical protein n=1 Tax=Thaumasiovibrio subtropicus TaxID=1891207 RepID=UPI000B361091|nr:hypothetical protein [Thaumasiovibrio subtropicus]